MNLQLEVRQSVVVSTAHMRQEDNAVLKQISEDRPHLVREFPYGWELVVATEEHQAEWEKVSGSYPDLSDALLANIMRLWQAVPGLYAVVLDCDAPVVEGLDAFDW